MDGRPQSRDPAPELTRSLAAVSGFLAAAVALGAGETLAGLSRHIPSPTVAVGDVVVDHAPFGLVEGAIGAFGTHDKLALIVGTVVIALGIGAALGASTLRHRWVGPLGFFAFAGFGVYAANRQHAASILLSALETTGSLACGLITLGVMVWLARRVSAQSRPSAEPRTVASPDEVASWPEPRLARRAFLGLSVAAAGVAVAGGALGARLRRRLAVEGARSTIALPNPAESEPSVAGAALRVPGLSPLVTPNDRFYRIDTAILVPQVEPADWTLEIKGRVRKPYRLDFDELLAMPMVEEYVTLACVSNEVGGRLVGNAKWLGVPLHDVLDRAGVDSSATQVVGRSVDGFTVGFPTEAAYDGRVALVAVGMNGEPLPVKHGFPARLVVAGLYGYVSATKWLSEIELTRFEDFDAYWVPRGWAHKAPIKTESRIDTPRDGRTVPAGTVPVAGVAWAPHRGIRAVEVQVDDGPWRPAELSGETPVSMWRQWVYRWPATRGTHQLRVRATDGAGRTQTAERHAPPPDGATGYHTISVDVAEA